MQQFINLKSVIAAFVFVAFVFAGWTNASAQSQSETPQQPTAVKVAVIDIEKIRREAKVVKSVRSQIDKYRNVIQADIKKEEDALRTANQELARKRSILSAEAFASERRKFEQRVGEVLRNGQERKQELEQAQINAMEKVQGTLNTIIGKIAEEESLNMIFGKAQMILVAKSLDITDVVLARLDKEMSDIKISDPGKGKK